MTPEQAQEFTEGLGQQQAGAWRLIALAVDLGVPTALGQTTEQWVTLSLGGYVRLSIPERRSAVKELSAEGMSQRAIASVLGVDQSTVSRDQPDASASPEAQEPAADQEPAAQPDASASPALPESWEWDEPVELAQEADTSAMVSAMVMETPYTECCRAVDKADDFLILAGQLLANVHQEDERHGVLQTLRVSVCRNIQRLLDELGGSDLDDELRKLLHDG